MKFAGYVAWILIYKPRKFGENFFYNSRDIEFFLGGYFFLAHPVDRWVSIWIQRFSSAQSAADHPFF